MHRRIRDRLINGQGGDDIFNGLDKMFEEVMKNPSTGQFQPREEFALSTGNFTSEWQDHAKGKTLVLKPKDPKTQLDINVKDQMISITSKEVVKNQNSHFESSSSTQMSVPYGCDGSKVQMKSVDNNIHLIFPCSTGNAPKEITLPQRRPIQKNSGDIEI